MSKDPTPKADGLRAMREASRGHLQATADTTQATYTAGAPTAPAYAPPKKPLIPFAGKDRREGTPRHGGIPYSVNPKPDGPPAPRKRVKHKRKIT